MEPCPPTKKKPTPRVDLLERLLKLFSEEQAAELLTMLEAECAISRERQNSARVEIVFRRGHPDYVNRIDGHAFRDFLE